MWDFISGTKYKIKQCTSLTKIYLISSVESAQHTKVE